MPYRPRTCRGALGLSQRIPAKVYKHLLDGTRAKVKHSRFVSEALKAALLDRVPARMVVCEEHFEGGHHSKWHRSALAASAICMHWCPLLCTAFWLLWWVGLFFSACA